MTNFYGQYVGFGAGDYTTPFTPGCFGGTGGGTQWGYACGGINQDYIFRNSYSSDVDATDIGNLTYTTNVAAGHSSATSGYCSGGTDGGNTNMRDNICRFTFAAAASIVAVGDLVTVTGSGLTRGRGFLGGGSSSTHGFSTGGSTGGNPGVPYSEIDIFPFASDVNSADHGDLSADRMTFSTASALTVMYTLAGEVGYTYNSIIDKIIFATSTPDYYIPGSGCLLQEKMGFNEIGALDIRVQCSGFLYGLSIAEQYIKTGMYKNILLVGAEVQSTAMEISDEGRDTAIIFGDGSGAAIICPTEEDRGILSTHMHSEGKHLKELWVEAPASRAGHPRILPEHLDEGKQYLKMNGREVFRHAVRRFNEVIHEGLVANNLQVDDIDMLIPHQANLRITQMIQKKLGLKDAQVYSNVHKYGNTTAASIPIALVEAYNEGKVSNGDIVVFASFGSGFTWASAILKW